MSPCFQVTEDNILQAKQTIYLHEKGRRFENDLVAIMRVASLNNKSFTFQKYMDS